MPSVAALAIVWSSIAGAAPLERFVCGVQVGVPTLDPLLVRPRAAAAYSIDDIAILEDGGTMVVGGVTNITPIANAFFDAHPDDFDQVFIYISSAYPGNIDPEAGFAYHAHLAGFVAGVNDASQRIGSYAAARGLSRAIGVCNLNDLDSYPPDPHTEFTAGGQASGVEVLAHEFLHGWSAGTQGQGADIIAEASAHWSFYLHHPGGPGNASPLFGNRWRDDGAGAFTTIESFNGYSQLDEHQMGLRAGFEVEPFFAVQFAGAPPFSEYETPAPGVSVSGGTRVDLTIASIEALYGPRLPDAAHAMKTFRTAFALVVPPGVSPPASDLQFLQAMRVAWEEYFDSTTEGRGAVVTTLGFPAAPELSESPFYDAFDGPLIDTSLWEWHQGPTIDSPVGAESALRLDGDWGSGDEIRSRMRDLSGAPPGAVRLEYVAMRAGNADPPEPGDDLFVEYWTSAGNWATVRVIRGDGPAQNAFQSLFNLLPPDAMHDRFRFRFRRAQGELGALDAYFIDEVRLSIVPCAADLDHNGLVDGADLGALLGAWGGADADLTGDGVVDGADLGLLLGAWGLCPS